MLIISFGWTVAALLARRKTCTRRDWNDGYAARFEEGQLLAAWDKSPRFHGHQVAVVQLTQKPYKELTRLAPESDWEAEGFAYLSFISAKIDGYKPIELWQMWHAEDMELWVVRFSIREILPQPKGEGGAG